MIFASPPPGTVSSDGPSSFFDAYAADYEAALGRGLALAGEDADYFAAGRIRWLAERLARMGRSAHSILDFGCGTGRSAVHFRALMPDVSRLAGADVSRQSIEMARRRFGHLAQFTLVDDLKADGAFDLVFCNGVFHHVPRQQRPRTMEFIARCLRPGGLLALWENNPWSPAARLVMRRIPFDRDAAMVWPEQARRLAGRCGLEPLATDFLFIFPRFMRWLRPLERNLARLPLGAQYMVLCRRASAR